MGKKLAGRPGGGGLNPFLSMLSHQATPPAPMEEILVQIQQLRKNYDSKMSKASCTGALLTYTRIKCP